MLILFVVLIPGCGKQERLKAIIFERKEISKNRLILKFRYVVNDNIYNDSSIISNKVITPDSIDIIIDPSHPEKGLPDYTK